MHVITKVGIAAAASAAAALSVAFALPAYADTAAQPNDIVGVGSDTLQNGVDFVFDGSPGQAGGYNGSVINRAINIDATGDANGRALYDVNGNSLASSVVLRAGTNPVLRPNGSGQGAAALTVDAPGNAGYEGLATGSIQFARMSRLPNSTEISNCPAPTQSNPNPTCGGLHVYQVATDSLTIAHVANGFAGPAGLSAQQLASIYQCNVTKWNQVGGTSSNTIVPLIPQSGSGTRNFFLADLAAAVGSTVTPGTCVKTVQEHDPSGIYNSGDPADAVEPFSVGKLALLNTGYFATGATGSPAASAYAPGYLTTESGTPSDGNVNYNVTRGLYVAVRQVDVVGATTFQPGGTQTWVQAVITGGNSAFRSANGRSEIAQAGFTAAYKDCGINPTSC